MSESRRTVDDWIESYVEFTRNTEPPESYRRWCAISMIASALERKCRLRWGTLTFYPNMYIVLVGPSGRARKGTAMSPALDMLSDLGCHMAAESTTREALVRALKESKAELSISADGKTPPHHCSLTIFSPELMVFLGNNNTQLLSDLTDWYDCRSKWTYRTKHQGTDEIIGVFVNLIGATTPELIRDALPSDAIGGGLTSRIIFIYEANKGKIVPAPFLSEADSILGMQLYNDLEQIYFMSGDFQTTSRFLTDWIEWYTYQEDHPPFDDERLAGYIERRPNHIMKLSMILNASRDGGMLIDSEDLERSVKYLGVVERNMTKVFSGVGKYEYSSVLVAMMNYIGYMKQVTLEQLTLRYQRDADPATLDTIIQSLVQSGFAKRVPDGGRTVIWHKQTYVQKMNKEEKEETDENNLEISDSKS